MVPVGGCGDTLVGPLGSALVGPAPISPTLSGLNSPCVLHFVLCPSLEVGEFLQVPNLVQSLMFAS